MNEYWGKLRWRFDEGSNTDIVDDIGVIDVLDVPMEKSDIGKPHRDQGDNIWIIGISII